MPTMIDKLNDILDEKHSKIIPENIKAGVTAFGVTGTYDGNNESPDSYIFPEFNYQRNLSNINNLQVGDHIRCRILNNVINPNIDSYEFNENMDGQSFYIDSRVDSDTTLRIGRGYIDYMVGASFSKNISSFGSIKGYGDYINDTIYNKVFNEVGLMGYSDVDFSQNQGWYRSNYSEMETSYYIGTEHKFTQNQIDEINSYLNKESIISTIHDGGSNGAAMLSQRKANLANFIQIEIVNN